MVNIIFHPVEFRYPLLFSTRGERRSGCCSSPFFRFQAVNDLVTELEQANITCAATITFAENDYKEQLQTLKVKNTLGLELIEFFSSRCFIYFFFLDLRHRDT